VRSNSRAEKRGSISPHNIEAEQAILGAILVDNAAFHLVLILSGAPGKSTRSENQ
jgi:hypothetical protein